MTIKFYDNFSSVLKEDCAYESSLSSVILLVSRVSKSKPKFNKYLCHCFHHSLDGKTSIFIASFNSLSQFISAVKKCPYSFYYDAREYNGIVRVVLSNDIVD